MEANVNVKRGAVDQVNPLVFKHGLWINGNLNWFGISEECELLDEEVSIKVNALNLNPKINHFEFIVTNLSTVSKEMKLFIQQSHAAPAVDQFCFVSPAEDVIFHLADETIYLVNGMSRQGTMKQCTVQPFGTRGTEPLWSCRETGQLDYLPMASGAAASFLSLEMKLGPHETQKSSCWAIEGEDMNKLIELNHRLLKNRLAFSGKK